VAIVVYEEFHELELAFDDAPSPSAKVLVIVSGHQQALLLVTVAKKGSTFFSSRTKREEESQCLGGELVLFGKGCDLLVEHN
jgi:hypothetical protein